MKNLFKADKLLIAAMIFIAVISSYSVYSLTNNFKAFVITAVCSLLSVIIMILYRIFYKHHMQNMFIKLSDMLDDIINMKQEEVFSSSEDTILAKLQFQTMKLTNILNERNMQIDKDRNEIKSLISDIAHQLKTPLSNLKLYSEFLQDDTISDEEREEFTNVIKISLDRLMFLIESMIKMSRLETGVIQVKEKTESLNDTVLYAISQITKKAEAKDIRIQLNEIDRVNIYHDKKWTAEAVLNLLDNAVKYSCNDSIINVTIKSYDMFVRIDVTDNGMGISEDELTKVFTRFYRGKDTGDIEGIGIGLYLAREIVTKQGGYMKVSSKGQGRGSTFSIFLPNKIEQNY